MRHGCSNIPFIALSRTSIILFMLGATHLHIAFTASLAPVLYSNQVPSILKNKPSFLPSLPPQESLPGLQKGHPTCSLYCSMASSKAARKSRFSSSSRATWLCRINSCWAPSSPCQARRKALGVGPAPSSQSYSTLRSKIRLAILVLLAPSRLRFLLQKT